MSSLKKNFEVLKNNFSQLNVEMLYNDKTSEDNYDDYNESDDDFDSIYQKNINPDASQSVINELVDWYEEEFGELQEEDRDELEEMIKEEYLFLNE